MTVLRGTGEFGPVKTVRCKSSTFEAVSDVGQIGNPSQIDWYGIKRNEETRKEQEWNRHDRCQEHTIL